jgi:beta-lactam-binding protein with PASTA domain
MGKELRRYGNWVLSVLVGIGVFLFWYVFYPHAYNVPDFTKTKVELDAHEAYRQVFDNKREQVKLRSQN